MLETIHIGDFKSIGDARLHLAELTLLIGANASGKSNVLEAIQLLSWIANNGRLENLHSAMKSRALRVRGAPRDLARAAHAKAPDVRLGCVLREPEIGALELSMALRQTETGLRVVEERLTAPELAETAQSKQPLYEVVEAADDRGDRITVQYNSFSRGRARPTIVCADQQAVFVQLVSPARFGATHTRSQRLIPQATSAVQRWLSAILFLDPNPSVMRGYSDRSDRRMHGDGANVSAVLYDLCEARGRKDEALAFIRSLPERDISDIRFVTTSRDEVLVELVETFGSVEQGTEAALLSDGTLRVLAVAAALLSVDEGSLVVIEEIDNGVHPSRAASLLKSIRSVAAERRLRVLLTTHNPALLDAVPPAALPDVTVCYRDPEGGGSKLARLLDLDRYPSLVAAEPLGALVTTGVVDRYVKAEPVDEEAATAAAMEWLNRLMPGGSGSS